MNHKFYKPHECASPYHKPLNDLQRWQWDGAAFLQGNTWRRQSQQGNTCWVLVGPPHDIISAPEQCNNLSRCEWASCSASATQNDRYSCAGWLLL